MLRLFSALILLCMAQFSFAATDFLNLENLTEGSTPSYAEGAVIGMVEQTGVKYLTAAPESSGKLKYPINLSGDFEVEFQIYKSYSRIDFELYLTADERHIKITTGHYDFDFEMGTDSQKADNDQSGAFVKERTNKFRLSVSNNVAKMYVNDVYSRKVSLTPDLTYTQLIASGIESKDALYSLSISGNAGTVGDNTGTITSQTDFEKGKQEGIQQCVSNPSSCGISVTTGTTTTVTGDCIASYDAGTGELNIPCINVPGAFGQLEMYDIWLKQLNGSLSFELDLNRITAK